MISEIILTIIILCATCVTVASVVSFKYASKHPANGELRQLHELDEDIMHFHKVVKKKQKADMRAYHSKKALKILT